MKILPSGENSNSTELVRPSASSTLWKSFGNWATKNIVVLFRTNDKTKHNDILILIDKTDKNSII